MGETIVILYPFHPLRGQELKVVNRPRRSDTFVVTTPDGSRLKVPSWMLLQEVSSPQVSDRGLPSVRALLCVAELVERAVTSDILQDQRTISGKEDSVATNETLRESAEGSRSRSQSTAVSGRPDGTSHQDDSEARRR